MKKILFGLSAFLAPVGVVFAQTNTNLFDVTDTIGALINTATTILVSIAVLILIYGIISYVIAGGDEEKQTKARSTIIYGVIGLFVIIAMWGLANILKNTFGTGDNQVKKSDIPCVPGTMGVDGQYCQ